MPLLLCPALWVADINRVAREIEPHPKSWIDNLAQYVLLNGNDEDRKTLMQAMQNFPINLPFFTVEESNALDIVKQRQRRFDNVALWADPSTWKVQIVSETDEGVLVSVEAQVPQVVQDKYTEEDRKSDLNLRIISISTKARTFRDDKTAEGRLSPEDAYKIVEEFYQQPETWTQVDKFIGETLLEGIAAIIAGLILHHHDWLRENHRVEWAREQILEMTSSPNLMADDAASMFSIGVSRSVALALPALLKHSPQDAKLENEIRKLISHQNYEVRNYLLEGLHDLWGSATDFVFECLSKGIRQALLFREENGAYQPKASDEIKITWGQLLSIIPAHPPRDVDYYGLVPVLHLLTCEAASPNATNPTMVFDCIRALLALTIKAHQVKEENGFDNYLFSAMGEWDPHFGKLLAEWVLWLPLSDADMHILKPLLDVWPFSAALLHEVMLFAAVAYANDKSLQSRFLTFWKGASSTILSLPSSSFADREQEEVLGLILFVDQRFNKSAAAAMPLNELSDLFEMWVQTVAHSRHGFHVLIRFCRDVVSNRVLSHGLRWLSESLDRMKDKDSALSDKYIASALADLLNQTWHKLGEQLKHESQKVNLQRFALLADELASRGNQLAVELRRKIYS